MPTRLYYTSYRNNAFDTHVFQNDVHKRLLTYASDAVSAFMQDLERIGRADDVVVMIFSEFGRRVPENVNLGTDHGTANLMFVAGKQVKGGQYGTSSQPDEARRRRQPDLHHRFPPRLCDDDFRLAGPARYKAVTQRVVRTFRSVSTAGRVVAITISCRLDGQRGVMKRLVTGIGVTILLFAPAIACAQILVAGEGPVVYGHHHLNTTNMDAEKKFFADTLGGTVEKIGSGDRQQEIIKFPNVLIFFRPMQAPTGGSIGTTVNHIGFSVPDLRPVVAKIKANGFKMITADSVAANVKVDRRHRGRQSDDEHRVCARSGRCQSRVRRSQTQKIPIQLNHIHFFGQMNTEMQAWYAKTFGAKMLPANPGSAFVQDQLPGVALNFTPSPTPTVGTTGRSIDHIGFEIKDLEAFTKKLEAQGIKLDRPYTKVPQLGIAIAFIKDPWGTNIELTRRTREHQVG